MFRPSPSIDYPARSQEDIIKKADPECKVDILAPGTMHLPHLRTTYIHWVDEIPLVPFSLLLVQKLQAWDDNRNAEESFRQYRQHKDAKDVKKLLGLKEFVEALTQIGSDGWANTELFSEEFQALTKERVKGYVTVFSSSAKYWRSLGFHLAWASYTKILKLRRVSFYITPFLIRTLQDMKKRSLSDKTSAFLD